MIEYPNKSSAAYVDGYRVMRDYTPKPLEPIDAYLERKRSISILHLVGLLVLGACVVAALVGDEPKTFASFLQMLQSAPSISVEWLSFKSITVDLPTWLNWLSPFIEFLESGVRVLGFFVTGIVNALTFILHFLTWVFV